MSEHRVSYSRDTPVALCLEINNDPRRVVVSYELGTRVQGYLAHKKAPAPPQDCPGPETQAYCSVLGGCVFL